jgi:hypothetical protein
LKPFVGGTVTFHLVLSNFVYAATSGPARINRTHGQSCSLAETRISLGIRYDTSMQRYGRVTILPAAPAMADRKSLWRRGFNMRWPWGSSGPERC